MNQRGELVQVLANSGTHNYAASEISHRALCAALPEYKLGAPASETQGNSSGNWWVGLAMYAGGGKGLEVMYLIEK